MRFVVFGAMLDDFKFIEEFRSFIEKMDNAPTPKTLWHYTSVDSAKSILETSTIHLGCYAFMNDPAEGLASIDVICRSIENVVASMPQKTGLREICRQLRNRENQKSRTPHSAPTFILSFSSLPDSLSQWSRYGDNGAGIALGFSVYRALLPADSHEPWRSQTELIQVAYGRKAAQGWLDLSLIASLCRESTEHLDGRYMSRTLEALARILEPRFKHGPYAEEKEWRLVTRTNVESTDVYSLKPGKFGIHPFVPLRFGEGIALTHIMLGPKLPPQNAWSVDWLCKKYGHKVAISASELAYR